jgi:uncharacterized oxidoreductase
MSANIKTILILGATSGLGEAFARHFHFTGKKVIASGRRIERLNALQSSLRGLETAPLDVTDFANLESNLSAILKTYPDLDSVFVMSGKMEFSDFKDPSSTSNEAIISEVRTNLIAPAIVSRVMVPHLLSLGKPATFITVSSGLAFIPLPFYPVYNATKAGIHTFTVGLRAQLNGTNVNVIELVPPYVDTDLNAGHRGKTEELSGGKGAPPMPLEQYMETAAKGFETEGVKEIATGFSELGLNAWRGALGPILKNIGIEG